MEELEALPVNQIILKKNPDIMNTIKKVSLVLLYSKTCLKWPLKSRQNKDLND